MGEFEDRVEALRRAAATFYTVDFHLHSPLSFDWDQQLPNGTASLPNLARIPDAGQPTQASIQEFRAACARSGRDVAVVADHNVARFGIAAAAFNDEQFCVLPGIEMSVTIDQPILKDHKIHVLAIFPESVGIESIGRVLPAGTPDDTLRKGEDVYAYASLDALVQSVHTEGGIVVAAHIYNDRGYRCEYRAGVELILEPVKGTETEREVVARFGDQVKPELAKFNCLQVKPTTENRHFLDSDGNLTCALVVGTDCHLSTALELDATESCSYVKMPSPSFDALCEAIKFPDTRIRTRGDLPEVKPPRLLGIRIHKPAAAQGEFLADLTLGFSDNLTCLIGPRGSGKSAAIDAVRYLFGLNRELPADRVAEQVKDRQGHTLAGARIEALYELPHGVVHRLEATFDPREDYVTRVFDSDGNLLNLADISASGDYPLSLYGWSELELLGESAVAQREMLDCFLPDVCALKIENATLRESLANNTAEIGNLAQQMERHFIKPELDFMRLRDYEREFEQLNTPEIQAVFESLDEIEAKRALLRVARRQLRALREAADAIPNFNPKAMAQESPHADWFLDLFKPSEGEQSVGDYASEASTRIKSRVETIGGRLDAEEVALSGQESEARKAIQEVAGDHDQVAGDLRNNAKRRMETAATNLADYTLLHEAFMELFAKRADIQDAIDGVDQRISQARRDEAESITAQIRVVEDEGFDLELCLNVGADHTAFLSTLTASASRGHFPGNFGQFKRVETIAANVTPRQFVAAILTANPSGLVGSWDGPAGQTYEIDEAYAEQVIEANTPATSLEGFDVRRWDRQRLEWLMGLEHAPCDDDFFVELGGRPIQYCSPGQRCSAMLPIVALTSSAPLIIDQPEDNLDNRLVSRTLFRILARLKESRQIIVATHNPNILVSGDAEQVLILSPLGDLDESGSIDKVEVVEHVISLMEGGAEAFRKRQTRYGHLIA